MDIRLRNRIDELTDSVTEKIIEDRRYLHCHPELSGKEELSSAYIAGRLREMGLTPKEHVGGYGVTAVIEGKAQGAGASRCIGLRADFDALPVMEATGAEFASENPGVMHACGHDVHASVLLGAAEVLSRMTDEFSGKIKLIFQPSEENSAQPGARFMIEDGCLEDPHVDAVIGEHVWPGLETGKVGIRNGAMMANSDRFYITVHGKPSHASAPDGGLDAIVASAHIISQLQTIVARNVSPFDTAVVTTSMINGGRKYNIIADEVSMTGNTRSLNKKTRDLLERRIGEIVRLTAEADGCTADYEYNYGVNATVNDPEMFEFVHRIQAERLGEDALVPADSAMTGEDFSFFTEKVPCAYYWLGVRDPEKYPDGMPALHNDSFLPDEKAIPLAIRLMADAAAEFVK